MLFDTASWETALVQAGADTHTLDVLLCSFPTCPLRVVCRSVPPAGSFVVVDNGERTSRKLSMRMRRCGGSAVGEGAHCALAHGGDVGEQLGWRRADLVRQAFL